MFPPAVERPWRDAWPLAAQAGDGNAWVTGTCWLYCRREGVAVLWVGAVATPGATGDVYACGPCVAELARMVRVQAHVRDGIADPAAQLPRDASRRRRATAATAGVCEHRQIEQREGKTHCRECNRQLYL
ncbi:hypothetical protein E6P78_27870 [Streptomyces sp. A0958]|uniref:hypothetical protein n=1 Tax=Streptomyces sp. A0958 TaxID=2563101 RepID=UPI00109E960B|nr:hypothetical protein [Streptomyces sp. A0958]THA60178.1 hypothetical protein E6P78_27870 [Streptomyces sp. A0958]